MRTYTAVAAVLLISVWSSSCFEGSTGTPISMQTLAHFQPGRATFAEVVAELGPPTSSALGADGSRSASYVYSAEYGSPTRKIPVVGPYLGSSAVMTRTLRLNFDQAGVLQSERFDSSGSSLAQGPK